MGRTQSDAATKKIVAWHELLKRAVDYGHWRQKFIDDGDELNLAIADRELEVAVDNYAAAKRRVRR